MLIIAAPWALLGLASLPAIVALHWYRRSYRERHVSALFLWGADAQAGGSGRVRQPLRQRLSLWLELLAALTLTVAAAGVGWEVEHPARRVVMVVDTRWSMQAEDLRPDQPPSTVRTHSRAIDRAIRIGQTMLTQLAARDRVAVVLTGRTPRLVAGPNALPSDAAMALTALLAAGCDQPDHDLEASLAFAAQVGGSGAEVVLFSDRDLALSARGFSTSLHGVAQPSSGFADAQWRADRSAASTPRVASTFSSPAAGRITAMVVATMQPVQRRWQVRVGAHIMAAGDIAAAPGAPGVISIPQIPAGIDRVELELLGADPLTTDDHCVLHRPPARMLRVRLQLPAGALREAVAAALRSAGDVQLVERWPWELECGLGTAVPATGALRVSFVSEVMHVSARSSEQVSAPTQLGPFLSRTGNLLLEGVDTTGLLWTGSATAPASGELPLWTAAGRVLLGERRYGRSSEVLIHLDFQRSQVHRHSAWPALWANLCQFRRQRLEGPERTLLRPYALCPVQLPVGERLLTIIAPDGVSAQLSSDSDGLVVIPGFERVGTWRLSCGAGLSPGPGISAREWQVEVAPFDPALMDFSSATTAERRSEASAGQAFSHEVAPWSRLVPLLLALVAMAGAWWAWRREER